MLGELWTNILINPMFNFIVAVYKISGNLGVAILVVSITIRLLIYPAYVPALKAAKKQRELKPELDKIKEKYKYDKRKQSELQMELFKKHGINPASGCISQIFALVIPFALYGVIQEFSLSSNILEANKHLYFESLKFIQGETLNTSFFYLNLAKPDRFFILPIITAVLTFLSSKMMLPAVKAGEKIAGKTPEKTDDMAYNVQEQMLYMMPVMMLVLGYSLPAGVMLNIAASTVFSIVQTYFVSGWGGLEPFIKRLNIKK